MQLFAGEEMETDKLPMSAKLGKKSQDSKAHNVTAEVMP